MLFDCIAKRRLPKRIEVISLLFLFGGTILAAGIIDADLSGIPWQGWAWGMASAVSFASFVMINQRQVEGMDTETRLLFTSFFAAIAIFFFQTPEIVWNGTLFGERFVDLRVDSRIIRDCHSDLSLFNCSAESWNSDGIHFKCDGTSSCCYRVGYFIERNADSTPSYRYYHYRYSA